MKIGILTYHRSHNYGALLQSVATRVVLEQLGHEAYYVDYWPGYHRRAYAFIDEKILFSLHMRRALGYIKNKVILVWRCKKLRRKNMNNFIKKYINPYCRSVSEHYDIILYGSDQIWRKQREKVGYNPIYFGQNKFKRNKDIAYAASMGILPNTLEDIQKLRGLLSHFDRISVREENLKDFLFNIGFKDIHVCIDPTLLLSQKKWDEILNIEERNKEKYVLFYDLLPDSFNIQELSNFATERQYKLKILHSKPMSKETPDNICTTSPKGFINLVRNAEFVFTSSFHGLVFAIIYHKPFLASFSRNAGRAESILQQLGLSFCLIPPMVKIPHKIKSIDFCSVEKKLNTIKEQSVQYLLDSLS